jgi:cobalt-precorrin 5A hydrolase
MIDKEDLSIAIIYFSNRGKDLALKIQQKVMGTYSASIFRCPSGGLYDITKELWSSHNSIIFISSTGIAVRAIASNILSKLSDPSVLVIDERANHVISLLSGHYGGGNALTTLIAEKIKSHSVITTATDINNIFAFDSFANLNHLKMKNSELIKHIARHMIDRKDDQNKTTEYKKGILVYSSFPVLGDVPKYIKLCEKPTSCDVSIDFRASDYATDAAKVLCLIPNNLVLGIGCRKATSFKNIEEAFLQFMDLNKIFIEAIGSIASIDLKKHEEGILEFSKKTGLPFYTYNCEELNTVSTTCSSEFVKETTGVGCVCESSAIYHATTLGNSNLIVEKTVINHITFALCKVDVNLHWNKGEK